MPCALPPSPLWNSLQLKAGKGRSGLMACVLLLRLGVKPTALDVLDFYDTVSVPRHCAASLLWHGLMDHCTCSLCCALSSLLPLFLPLPPGEGEE